MTSLPFSIVKEKVMIGDRLPNGTIQQSIRTTNKIEENLACIVRDFDRIAPGLSDAKKQELATVIWNGLAWTAEDVLKQAIEDGYKATH
jgi:hypothetical protein